jgi:glycosyltransferase involved in cell wall biosynthesis
MKIKTFGYKETPGGYLEVLEDEWKKLGHEIVDGDEYDIIFNIDRSQIEHADEERRRTKKPLYCLILDMGYSHRDGHFSICDNSLIDKEKPLYKNCHKLMTISDETGRVLKEFTGLNSENVGIPALSYEYPIKDNWKKRKRGDYIYYFGRPLDPIKNIVTVLQAISGTGIEIYFSGEPCPPQLFSSIAPNINVKNFGWLNRKDVNDLIKNAKLLIASELYTGLGMQPIEGALMGTPCLSADIPIKREIWGDILPTYEAGDPLDCRVKIQEFDPSKVNMREARKIASWYLPKNVAKRILAEKLADDNEDWLNSIGI